jgi:hypothetical protein
MGEDESRCNKKNGERNGVVLVSDITYDTCRILLGNPDGGGGELGAMCNRQKNVYVSKYNIRQTQPFIIPLNTAHVGRN